MAALPTQKVPVRKQLVRNVEIPIRKDNHAIRSVRVQPNLNREPVPGAEPQLADNSTKYRQPGLRTTKELQEHMQRVRIAPIPASRNVNDLTPKAQELVQEKAAQKLNFPATKAVFNKLEPINVNDSVLELKCHTFRPHRRSVIRQDKDPEPVLADYLRPVPLLSSQGVLDDFGCEEVLIVRPPTTDNYRNVCQVLDMLDCDL